MIFKLLLIWCLLSVTSKSQNLETIKIEIPTSVSLSEGNNLFEKVPLTLLVKEVSYTSDVYISQQEFDYLTNIRAGKVLQQIDLVQACFYLQLKNKFSLIIIELQPLDDGYHLNINLQSEWTFINLKVQGLLTGNDCYRQYYLLEPGEVFDISKHKDSLERIKEGLHEQGYYHATVYDRLDYDITTKTVKVTIFLDRQQPFTIQQVHLQINSVDEPLCLPELTKKVNNKYLKYLEKKYYSQELLNRITKYIKDYLLQKGFFNPTILLKEQIHYDLNVVDLNFEITIHQKKRIYFIGNRFFNHHQLFHEVLNFSTSVGFLPESILIQEIVDAYYKKGFCEVQVNLQEEQEKSYFIIKEGPRININELIFDGISDETNKVVKILFNKIMHKYYDSDELQIANNRLLNWYHKKGFWDSVIVKQELIKVTNTTYMLKTSINEGEQRLIHKIYIENYEELEQQWPYAKIIKNNELFPADKNLILEQRQWLIHYFQQKGYMSVQVDFELIKNGQESYDLYWHITKVENPLKFGKIILMGSAKSSFDVIMRELLCKQHDIWNKQLLEQSLIKLRDLNIFETVYFQPYKNLDIYDQKPVLIKLIEDDPFEIRLRCGFQQVSKNLTFRKGSTIKVGGSFMYKNVTHVADILQADTDVTRFYRNFTISYVRPWIFNTPITMLWRGYSNKFIQPVFIGSQKPLYQAIAQGFLVGFRKDGIHAGYGINIAAEQLETNDLSVEIAQAINFSTVLIDKKIPYFYLEPSVLVNYLDNELDPTKGSLSVVSCKIMIPWKRGGVNFFKMLAEQSVFFSIKKTVFGFRFRVGHIFNQDFAEIMPPDRFYLGGENSIRSYQPNFAPPLGSYIDKEGERQFVPQGGRTMFNSNFEIRFPLIWQLRGVIFQDVGTLVEHSLSEIEGSRFLTATGFGLRYTTPIGPLRFDIGWKWRKFDPQDCRFAWFLTLGHAF